MVRHGDERIESRAGLSAVLGKVKRHRGARFLAAKRMDEVEHGRGDEETRSRLWVVAVVAVPAHFGYSIRKRSLGARVVGQREFAQIRRDPRHELKLLLREPLDCRSLEGASA